MGLIFKLVHDKVTAAVINYILKTTASHFYIFSDTYSCTLSVYINYGRKRANACKKKRESGITGIFHFSLGLAYNSKILPAMKRDVY